MFIITLFQDSFSLLIEDLKKTETTDNHREKHNVNITEDLEIVSILTNKHLGICP